MATKAKHHIQHVGVNLSKVDAWLPAFLLSFIIESILFPSFYFLKASDATGIIGDFGKFFIWVHWPALKFTQFAFRWIHFHDDAPVMAFYFTACLVECFLFFLTGIWLMREFFGRDR